MADNTTSGRVCRGCGGEMPPRDYDRPGVLRYCSKDCERKHTISVFHERYVATFVPKTKNTRVRPLRPRTCEQCGSSFESRGARRFCSQVCQKRFRAEDATAPRCESDGCDRAFYAKGLCAAHYWAARKAAGFAKRYDVPAAEWTDPKRDRMRNHSQRRRALKVKTSLGERVLLAKIAERDGYRCGICHRKVNMKLVWPHVRSPSIDHVVPLSLGGVHDPTNAQLAHLRCNLTKGIRIGEIQLALIG